jgi:hypothetical protein
MSDALSRPTRRQALVLGGGLAATAVLWGAGTGTATAAGETWRGNTSSNGWPIVADVPRRRIEGAAGAELSLLDGDVATVLLYVARRFSYEIDTLRPGDVRGHSEERRIAADFESNHLSGTAMAIRPLFYPLGAEKGTGLSAPERIVVQDIIADCEGVVAWGGELNPVKESHFHIDVHPGDERLSLVARRIQGWNDTPGRGAGAVDAFDPRRRRRARAAAAAR